MALSNRRSVKSYEILVFEARSVASSIWPRTPLLTSSRGNQRLFHPSALPDLLLCKLLRQAPIAIATRLGRVYSERLGNPPEFPLSSIRAAGRCIGSLTPGGN